MRISQLIDGSYCVVDLKLSKVLFSAIGATYQDANTARNTIAEARKKYRARKAQIQKGSTDD